ncbi:MAG: rhodanese-like domain-containing protein [Gammaproteobacteria bacterium]|jgi:rhodanese-related sulfurtransferase|nr:rhodanese-like domain-containing protein [Gammaproteobacteria bacterium]
MNKIMQMAVGVVVSVLSINAIAENKPVGITGDMMSVTVKHAGADVDIVRNQDNAAIVKDAYAKTSRPCPPFCIQPIKFAPGIETLGEVEVIDYVQRQQAGENILVVDSRTPDWVKRGTIPGATNIPFTDLHPSKSTTATIMNVMLNQFGVKLVGDADEFDVDEALVAGTVSDVFDYSDAKTLVLFCNGMWCGQSPASMKTLMKFGYPQEKIKWFRGGMQTWEILGLSVAM